MENLLMFLFLSFYCDLPTFHKSQTTVGSQIHVSYKTNHYEALYEIPKFSTTTINHGFGHF